MRGTTFKCDGRLYEFSSSGVTLFLLTFFFRGWGASVCMLSLSLSCSLSHLISSHLGLSLSLCLRDLPTHLPLYLYRPSLLFSLPLVMIYRASRFSIVLLNYSDFSSRSHHRSTYPTCKLLGHFLFLFIFLLIFVPFVVPCRSHY